MKRLVITWTVLLSFLMSALIAAPVSAGGGKPVRTSDSYTETFVDEFILDLCGIETETTLTESWTRYDYPDGTFVLFVTRRFVPADRRIPIEKGHGFSINRPDGSQVVVGTPLWLISQLTGRTLLRDTGVVEFDPDGNVVRMVGPHPSIGKDLTPYYCPGPPD